MSEGKFARELPNAAETDNILQFVKPEVIDQEGDSPRGVKRPINEEWPTGHEWSQQVTADPEEGTSTGLGEEDAVDTHPFLSLLIQAGYTKWWLVTD